MRSPDEATRREWREMQRGVSPDAPARVYVCADCGKFRGNQAEKINGPCPVCGYWKVRAEATH